MELLVLLEPFDFLHDLSVLDFGSGMFEEGCVPEGVDFGVDVVAVEADFLVGVEIADFEVLEGLAGGNVADRVV